MKYDVAIIGAGVAGLIAARDLARAGRTVALLEARDRIGGRLREIADQRAAAPIELGAEFVHGRPPTTYGLLREYGSTVIDNSERRFALRDGSSSAADNESFAAAGDLLATALARAQDESVDALIARRSAEGQPPAIGKSARLLVSGFDAAHPARASARAIAREWAGDASAAGAQSRPVGGYAPLVAHLARSLDPAHVHVRLGTIVTAVTRTYAGVRVAARTLSGELVVDARHAVVAVPHGVLRAASGAAGGITFDPPLPPAITEAIGQIAMGPVIKVVLCFRTPFWETLAGGAWNDGAFFSADDAFPTLWTQLPVRANTLVAWAGGDAADRLAAGGNVDYVQAALACVGRYFGAAHAAEHAFEAGYVHDWQRDPFARGAYSYVLVGGENARAALSAPIDGNLWFAGEATAANGEGGTVAGGLESGVRVASAILADR